MYSVVDILLGNVDINAEMQLINNFGNTIQLKWETQIVKRHLLKTKALIELAGNVRRFKNMRSKIDIKVVFYIFVNICLVYFCSLLNSQYKA